MRLRDMLGFANAGGCESPGALAEANAYFEAREVNLTLARPRNRTALRFRRFVSIPTVPMGDPRFVTFCSVSEKKESIRIEAALCARNEPHSLFEKIRAAHLTQTKA